jgi:hypothetical protein
MRLGSRGESGVSNLMYLLVAVMVIYVVVKVIPPYMDYYAMEDEVTQQVKMAKINSPDVIRNDLVQKARELEIKFEPDGFRMSYGNNDRLQVYMHWKTRVDFGYGIERYFEFEIDSAAVKSDKE